MGSRGGSTMAIGRVKGVAALCLAVWATFATPRRAP
jgi:hypothetical protein